MEINPNVRFVNHIINANQSNHYIPWRILYDYEFLYVTNGSLEVITDKTSFTVNKGDLHIMSPFIYHKRSIKENSSVDYFNMHLDLFFNSNIDEDFSVDNVYIKPTLDPSYKPIETNSLKKRKKYEGLVAINIIHKLNENIVIDFFKNLIATFNDDKNNNLKILKIKSLFFEFLHYLITTCEEQNLSFFNLNKNANNDIVSSFITLIKQDYNKDLNLAIIAKSFGISQNYFYKIFKAEMNISPQEYILDFRIQESKKLLLTRKYYIGEVANMIGYSNSYYFSRLFKQKEGISPEQYVKNNNKN